MRFMLILAAAATACSPAEKHGVPVAIYEGTIDLGPHGPVFTPRDLWFSNNAQVVPWRVSGKGPALDAAIGREVENAKRIGMPPDPAVFTVRFKGYDTHFPRDEDGFDREAVVVELIELKLCDERKTTRLDCLGREN